jgi:hypothetical protein
MHDLLIYIHVGALGVAALGMAYADHEALAWLRGKKDTLFHGHLLQAHHLVAYALSAIIVSGLLLFWPMRDYLLAQPLFLLKIGFVAALVANSFAIERLMHMPTRHSFRSLTRRQKFPLMLSGAVSLGSWVAAGTLALVLFY